MNDKDTIDRADKAGLAIIEALADIMEGRKVVCLQHIERPVEARDDPALGQWDTFLRVLDADDEAGSRAPEGRA